MAEKVRNSSFELLKIIAIEVIVFSHGMPDAEMQDMASAINLNCTMIDW